MLNYSKVEDKPGIFQNFTGLSKAAFEALLASFESAHEEALDERDKARKMPRRRARGGGRKAVLATAADKLLFILFYDQVLSYPPPVQRLSLILNEFSVRAVASR